MIYPKGFIAYGSQYYRAPTPFQKYWEEDLKKAADAGFNTMKFWVQWRSNSPKEGQYDFSDIARLMELCEKNHLKAILSPIFDGAPTWFGAKYPDCWMITSTGRVMLPQLLQYRQIGGSPAPCLNHPEARDARAAFMQALAGEFADHPALLLWDLWNEVELTNGILRAPVSEELLCYCGHCRDAFIKWLKAKYGDIESLNDAWHGYFGSFEEMDIPRGHGVPKPFVDWRMFFTDVCAEELRMRREAVRGAGDDHPVMVHTVPMPYFNNITTGSDDYKLAKECDMFGCSIGSEPFASAVTASAAPGKVCIASEIHAMGGSTYARPAKPTFADFKKHVFVPLARGMKGFQYWQFRPEMLGNEAPAWGLLDLRGRTKTPQFEYAKRINDALQPYAAALSRAMPQKAQIAILNNGKNEIFDWVHSGNINIHYQSVKGIFDALYSKNYMADILSEQQMQDQPLDGYKFIVTPFPYYMEKALADKLRDWVEKGGHLLSEAFFAGVSDENGCFNEMQPGFGFDEVFGAEEISAQSAGAFRDAYTDDRTEDQIDRLRVPMQSADGVPAITGFHFVQSFETKDGAEVLAAFEDGSSAVVTHRYGQGTATVAGTLLGYRFTERNAAFIAGLAERAGVFQTAITGKDIRVDALYEDEACRFLIISNNSDCDNVPLRIPALAGKRACNLLTKAACVFDSFGTVNLNVPKTEMDMFVIGE